eukprot:CAMPEP_0202899874 /NCGR_PEP_ID=MMETSP1392-20130828/9125_1 /ASSEMBLY_ACC=CAM_ASM_000868 /TAXON_ID=225041 /ORGANISM="Chlamydomonas chlamydogama, Strain SAG 11-48b" /LENGTH=99 /DNA_ID=CAMNT_0049586169 /DNA_START=257 /DNA_END=553 /DNA_ORIENTATION=+
MSDGCCTRSGGWSRPSSPSQMSGCCSRLTNILLKSASASLTASSSWMKRCQAADDSFIMRSTSHFEEADGDKLLAHPLKLLPLHMPSLLQPPPLLMPSL